MIWGQNFNTGNRVPILPKMALRIIKFQSRDCHSSPLFKKQSLHQFKDKIQLESLLLVSKCCNNILQSIFENWLKFYSDKHKYNTIVSSTGKLFKQLFKKNLYGKHSITISEINAWNKIQTAFGGLILENSTTTQIKTLLNKKCIYKY